MNRRKEKTKISAAERFRDMLAVDTAKAAAAGSRLFGWQGTSLPGKAAMAIDPDVLKDLAGQVRGSIFAVCGTNGKTTVNNILCTMLEAGGRKVVCNRLGANMPAGIAGAFTASAGLNGSLDADYACLEIDEASARLVFSSVHPDYLILTNLFRDQLDRYGEIDITIRLLTEAVRMVPDMKLIINADDPLSVYLAQEAGNPYICYGINGPVNDHLTEESCRSGEKGSAGKEGNQRQTHEIREGRFCKKCGAQLHYAQYYYGQMGVYRCTACDFKRPEPQYAAEKISTEGKIRFSVEGQSVEANFRGLYSIYNLLAVWSVLREENHPVVRAENGAAGIPDATVFNEILSHYHTQFGRNETFCINGCSIVLNLAKNPAGFNQNIDAMLEDRGQKNLIVVINDNEQDGTDVSWLWDVDFDRIRDDSIRKVTVSGIRALDMGLRLKYVGIEADIAESAEEAIDDMLADSGKLYILVNYTALFSIHQYLLKREQEEKSHKRHRGKDRQKQEDRR